MGPEGFRGGTLRIRPQSDRPADLLYVERGGIVYLIPAASRTHWAAGALTLGRITLEWTDGRREVRGARLELDPGRATEVRGAFRRIHGEERWHRYFEGRPKVVCLALDGPGIPPTYSERLRAEFDAVAPHYTEAIERDPLEVYLRRRSRARLLALFEGKDPILELGCGTGRETLHLLAAGHRVTAVDIAPAMLAELGRRAGELGLQHRLRLVERRLSELGPEALPEGGALFAGGFSTFGALNLETDPERIARTLAPLLTPGAPFFAGVLNRHAVAPVFYAFVAGRPREGIERLRYPIRAEGSRYPLDVYPTTRRRFVTAMAPYFRFENGEGAMVLGPSDDVPRLRRWFRSDSFRSLTAMDARLCRTRIGLELAEWQFLTFLRTDVPTDRL